MKRHPFFLIRGAHDCKYAIFLFAKRHPPLLRSWRSVAHYCEGNAHDFTVVETANDFRVVGLCLRRFGAEGLLFVGSLWLFWMLKRAMVLRL